MKNCKKKGSFKTRKKKKRKKEKRNVLKSTGDYFKVLG